MSARSFSRLLGQPLAGPTIRIARGPYFSLEQVFRGRHGELDAQDAVPSRAADKGGVAGIGLHLDAEV
jgi:hypothetical protein